MNAGGCLCGAVRYEVRGPLRDVLVCHCSECRRWSGQAWPATAARRDDLVLVSADALRWVVSPESDANASRGFCSECGSCLFWDAPGWDHVAIGAGTLDDAVGLKIAARAYIRGAPPHDPVPDDGTPRFDALPT
ncbi:MAG TPA: GFA family protein [Gaiellaceae bacterium]|nr:GFA family protein [Gaiellaceae bacterium]